MKVRTLLAVVVLSTGCAAGGGGSAVAPGGAGATALCRDELRTGNLRLGRTSVDVAEAYAAAAPVLVKLALTGALRSGTITTRDLLQGRPEDVPADVRRVLSPLVKAFARIKAAIRAHTAELERFRDLAERCSEDAREAGDACLEQSAAAAARQASRVIRLVRRLERNPPDLGDAGRDLERHTMRLQQATADQQTAMARVEACLT